MKRLPFLLFLGCWLQPLPAAPFLEASLDPPEPWVQQQVRYLVRLYRDSHLQQGHFLAPEIPDVLVIEAGGTSEPRRVVREGREMELLEQEWLLFPQRSGSIGVPPPVFSGRDFYLRGEPLQLEVRPRPADSGGFPWLVTPRLEVTEQWSGSLTGLKPGQHRVRRIRIQALAQTGAQLPVPETAPVEGFEIQPLPARVSWRFREGGLLGERIQAFRYLAVRAAEGEVPPLSVKWWNPESARVEERQLPARPYRILSGFAQEEQPSPAAASGPPQENVMEDAGFPLLPLLTGAVVMGLLGALVWFRRRRLAQHLSWLAARLQLWSACRRGDCRRATRVLMEWRRDHGWPELDPLLLDGWNALDRACWGGEGNAWDGSRAWRVLRRLVQHPERGPGEEEGSSLPPLWHGSRRRPPGVSRVSRRRR